MNPGNLGVYFYICFMRKFSGSGGVGGFNVISGTSPYQTPVSSPGLHDYHVLRYCITVSSPGLHDHHTLRYCELLFLCILFPRCFIVYRSLVVVSYITVLWTLVSLYTVPSLLYHTLRYCELLFLCIPFPHCCAWQPINKYFILHHMTWGPSAH